MAATQVAPSPSNNLEAKILQALSDSEIVVSKFSPMAAEAIAAGVAVEPMIKSVGLMFKAIFTHHTKVGQ